MQDAALEKIEKILQTIYWCLQFICVHIAALPCYLEFTVHPSKDFAQREQKIYFQKFRDTNMRIYENRTKYAKLQWSWLKIEDEM